MSATIQKHQRGVIDWLRFRDRADAEIPCARNLDECGLRDHPWAPCCKLRGAAWFGEPFPTDYLPDEGFIHLFGPVDPACPEAPRKSAGCVRLVEPSIDGWNISADAERFDRNLDAYLDMCEREE